MSAFATIAWYSVLWASFGIGSGWLVNRVPPSALDHDTFLTRLRPFERRGFWYDRHLRVRVWKDRLPEAGAMFRGGASKATLPGFGPAQLGAFVIETRRAEYVHWANAVFGLTFVPWSPWTVSVVMIAFGLVVHLPFVIVQRYNRARLRYVLSRSTASSTTRTIADRGTIDPSPAALPRRSWRAVHR